MATYYSSLYSAIPNRGYTAGVETVTTSYVYKGPTIQRSNEPITVYATFGVTTFAFASTDSLVLCPAPSGVKILSFTVLPSADLDTATDFTFDVGFTGATNGVLNDSALLQGAVGVSVAPLTLLTLAASTADTNNLVLTSQAGDLNTAGTLHFLFQLVRPQ